MNFLIIMFSLLAGYVFFMMSFYLLSRVLFPKITQSPDEEDLLSRLDVKTDEDKKKEVTLAIKRSKQVYRFKQPQVA